MDAKILHGGATCEFVREVSVPGAVAGTGLSEQGVGVDMHFLSPQ